MANAAYRLQDHLVDYDFEHHQEEMLELAVANGVKVLILTRHTDCAAEKAAKNPELRAKYPAMVAAVDERHQRTAEFLARPVIAERIKAGELLVKQLDIDTATEHLAEHVVSPADQPH